MTVRERLEEGVFMLVSEIVRMFELIAGRQETTRKKGKAVGK